MAFTPSLQLLNAILIVSGVSGVAAGMALMSMRGRMQDEPNHRLRQWLLEYNLVAVLNRYRRIERPLYRHHRIFGALVFTGDITLIALLGRLQNHLSVTNVWTDVPGVRIAMLVAWVLAIAILMVGISLYIRPSALKRVEALANRWVEPLPLVAKPSVPAHRGIGRLILHAPVGAGLVLIAAGAVCLLAIRA